MAPMMADAGTDDRAASSRPKRKSRGRCWTLPPGMECMESRWRRKIANAQNRCCGLKPVLEVAKENAAKAGVGDRYSTIAGSAFDVDFGSDYDVVLVPNFLHHSMRQPARSSCAKVHAAR